MLVIGVRGSRAVKGMLTFSLPLSMHSIPPDRVLFIGGKWRGIERLSVCLG